MKILMVAEAWFPHFGGGQVHVWELSKALADKGHQVVIITRNNGPWNEPYKGVEVKRLGNRPVFSNIYGRLQFLYLAFWQILSIDADIIHLHAFSSGLLAPLLKFFKKGPIIFTVHGEGFKVAGTPFKLAFLQDLVFYKIAYDGEITVALKTLTRKPAAKIVRMIPNGVHINNWKEAQRKRPGVKNIIFVGRLVKDKGADLLIEAFRSLNDKKISLSIVGDGPELANLKRQAKGLKVKFLGQEEGNKLVQEMKKADLYVMPSRVEGMPIRLLEAWAAKIPVVATRVGDNEKYIIEGKTGFLADPSAESLARAITKAINSKNTEKISEFAFKKVQGFTWEEIANQTIEVYREVLDEKSQS